MSSRHVRRCIRFRWTLLIALAAAPACVSPRIAAGPPLIASDALVSSQQRAAEEALRRLQAAIGKPDTGSVLAILAPNVVLITLAGDTLRGAAAGRYLLAIASVPGKPLALVKGRQMSCLQGGVLDFDGELLGVPELDHAGVGRYSIRWSADTEVPRARHVVVTYSRSTLRDATTCTPEFQAAVRLRRFIATVGVDVHPTGSSPGLRQVRDAMRTNGFDYSAPGLVISGPGAKPLPYAEEAPFRRTFTAGMRYRVDSIWSMGLQLAARQPDTVIGFDRRCSAGTCDDPTGARHTYVAATTRPMMLALLSQFNRGGWRAGLGPAVQAANWKVREEERTMRFVTGPYGTESGWAYPGQAISQGAVAPSLGIGGEVAFTLPFSRRVLAEVHVAAAAFSSAERPGTTTLPAQRVSNRFARAGLSLGIGWK